MIQNRPNFQFEILENLVFFPKNHGNKKINLSIYTDQVLLSSLDL